VSIFVRKVKTKSGATAVQIIQKSGRQVVAVDHIGSAHSQAQLDLLIETARKKVIGGQLPLFSEPKTKSSILSLSAASLFLYQTLQGVYRRLMFNQLNDVVFEQLVIARLIEPSSKLDTIRILDDLGLQPPSYTGIHRCLKRVIDDDYRHQLAKLCFQASSPFNLSLLLYDVTTLYFETQQEDEFRKSGLSKERRLEPQIVVGLLVDRSGFPLELHEFEGNLGETKTMIPVVKSFCERHHLDTNRLTITADAGMLSSTNLDELEAAGFSFIVGSRIAKTPYQIQEFKKTNPEEELLDGQIFETTQSFGYKKEDKIKRRVIYQYKHKRAQLDLMNLKKQILKAKRIIAGQAPLKKSTFLTLTTTKPSLNHKLILEHQLRAGIKGYVTNLPAPPKGTEDVASPLGLGVPAQEVVDNYHQLFQVEKSFRMSKSDLKARPIFHHKLDSIRAHLTVVFAALAIGRFVETQTKLSLKKFIHTLKVVRTSTLLINGEKTQVDPYVSPEILSIVENLRSGY